MCNVELKSQIKYLWVFIDEHLKWDAQLQHINNKITKNIGISFKLRYYVPMSTLKQLRYTLMYPYLMYGIMSWGTVYQTKLNKTKISQNNCICCIVFANKRESPTPYFTLLENLGPGQTINVWRPNTIKHCLVTKHANVEVSGQRFKTCLIKHGSNN